MLSHFHFQHMQDQHGITVARSQFMKTTKRMRASGSSGKVSEEFSRADYYLKEGYLEHITKRVYDAYVPHLDPALEAQVGYALPPWEDVSRRRTELLGT